MKVIALPTIASDVRAKVRLARVSDINIAVQRESFGKLTTKHGVQVCIYVVILTASLFRIIRKVAAGSQAEPGVGGREVVGQRNTIIYKQGTHGRMRIRKIVIVTHARKYR